MCFPIGRQGILERLGGRLGPEGPEGLSRVHGALSGVGGVVGVDRGGSVVAVSHPFLDGTERRAGCCHLSTEGVAEVVEADWPELGTLGRLDEAFAQLGG